MATTKRKPKDPYQALGVKKGATPADIRKAHRRRAKETHPDAGGDAEEFRAVQSAYKLLSDDSKRRKFDETGDCSDEPTRGPAVLLGNVVLALLSKVVADPEKFDFVHAAETALSGETHRLQGEMANMERNTKQLEKAKRRLKDKEGFIAAMLEQQSQNAAMRQAALRKEMADIEEAAAYLRNCSYQVDEFGKRIGGFVWISE